MRDVERITIRLSVAERDAWQVAAGGELVPLGRWVRQVVNERVRAGAPLAGEGTRRADAVGSVSEEASGSQPVQIGASGIRPSPASGDRFALDCSNKQYHQAGRLCRWCGGNR